MAKIKRGFKNVFTVSLVTVMMVTMCYNEDVHAATRTITFSESTSQTQTQTINLPNLKSINSISSNTGIVSIQSVNGDNVTIRLSGGSYSRRVQTGGSAADSTYVTNQTSPYYNSGGYSGTLSQYLYSGSYTPSDSIYVTNQTSSYYNSGGYGGSLSSYVYSGSYTASQSKSVTYVDKSSYYQVIRLRATNTICSGSHIKTPSTIQYSDAQGYSGTLNYSGYEWADGWLTSGAKPGDCSDYDFYWKKYAGTVTKPAVDTRVYRYQGTVTKPASDTRVYRYQGTVYKPDTRTYQDYYQYSVTVNYEDNSPPTTPGLFSQPTSSTMMSGGRTINVSWGSSTDPDGNLIRYELQFYNGSSWSTLTASTTGTSYSHTVPNVSTTNAQYRVRAYDGIEYSSYRTSSSFTIDSTSPTGTLTQNTANWTNQSIVITASGSDTGGSGFYRIRKPDGTYTNSTSTTYTVSANGTYNFTFEDNVGNTFIRSINISNIDKTSPAGSLTQNTTNWTDQNVVITATGSDTGGSGFYRIRKPDGTYANTTITTYSVSTNGTYSFEYQDNAGNMVARNITISNIDKEKPTIAMDIESREWAKEDINVSVLLSDTGGSGVKDYRYQWTENATKPASGWSAWLTNANPTLTKNQNGKWYLHVEVRDHAGNEEYQYAGMYKLDNTPPLLQVDGDEIIEQRYYSYIAPNKLRFKGTVSEDIAESNIQVFYYYRDVRTGEKMSGGDMLVYEQLSNVNNAKFSGSMNIEPTMKNGDYELVIYAKNHVGLIADVTIPFSIANPSVKPNIDLSIYPAPTGEWKNHFFHLYVTEKGDMELIKKAVKKYKITHSPIFPEDITQNLGNDQKILLNQVGENYLHVQYTLDDGTTVNHTSGPYLIDTADVGNFEMKLINENGVEVNNWTNQALELVIGDPSIPSMSGIEKQYRIENYHTGWQVFKEGTLIELEGKHRVFARIVNKSGTAGEQRFLHAMIDKKNPEIEKVVLEKNEKGTYNVSVTAKDPLSGIMELTLNEGSKMTSNGSIFTARGLTTRPNSLTAIDQAGNVLDEVLFASDPVVIFESPYTLNEGLYRKDIKASIIGGNGEISYQLGNKLYRCETDPCELSIERNTVFTAIHEDGIKQTKVINRIENIDKSDLMLVLSGKRDMVDPTKIHIRWNYDINSGTLYCHEGEKEEEYSVSELNYTIDGKNYIYDCYLKTSYNGEDLTSNRVIIYPDTSKPLDSGGDVSNTKIDSNIYIEELGIGTEYFINTKSNNYKFDSIPFPKDAFH